MKVSVYSLVIDLFSVYPKEYGRAWPGKRHMKNIAHTMAFVFAVSYFSVTHADTQQPRADPDNPEIVKQGKKVYMRFCSLCHGRNLEGQKNWRVRKPDGKLPAPPHNETGHTWHHSDVALFEITKFGLIPPHAPEGYKSDMPAWKDTLSDTDIWAVLSFIKSQWPEKEKKYQQQFNTDN